MNCSLAEDFTKTPSLLYQNYLREFWCTVMASDLNPPIDSSKARPYREFIIKFTVKNGQNPLTLDYKTFCESTGLDYNNDQYVDHPSTEVLKIDMSKIATNAALVQKTTILKISFPVAWRILLTFVVQATVTPPSENVPTKDSDKTQSVSSGQTTHPQDTEGST
ncbi:hypothetical protein Tco_1385500 [Tanacetum coccineum]